MGSERKPCGTRAAAERHRRKGEPLCEPCREAERQYRRDERTRKAQTRGKKMADKINQAKKKSFPDREEELLEMYAQLSGHMGQAPPQSVASIARQRLEVLDRLTDGTGKASGTRNGVDELAKRRKERHATA